MESLLSNPDVQEIAISLAALIASAGFAALKGTEVYRSLVVGREEKILKYVETGVRVAYGAYVRKIKRQTGRLTPQQAQTARDLALTTAVKEAKEKGDGRLIQRLSDEELNATLEAVLQEIKAAAAIGEGARTSTRTREGGASINGILLAVMALPLLMSGCTALGFDVSVDTSAPTASEQSDDRTQIVIRPGATEREAMGAWEVWRLHGDEGALPDMQPVTEAEDRMTAYRNGAALMIYATAQIRSRRPVPDARTTIAEASRCVSWYLREAFPHLQLSWFQLYDDMRGSNPMPPNLAPIFESMTNENQ